VPRDIAEEKKREKREEEEKKEEEKRMADEIFKGIFGKGCMDD